MRRRGRAQPFLNRSRVDNTLLNLVVDATATRASVSVTRLDAFLSEREPWQALLLWLDLPTEASAPTRDDVVLRLVHDIAHIDELLSSQVDAILHSPPLQALEARWRGLRFLTECVEEEHEIVVRVLDVTWKELARDQERSIEFDQSHLFRLVYNAEFGMPGGLPYGLLLGDYEIQHRPDASHPVDDVACLRGISQVAAAAFAPFVASASPRVFGLDHFTQLERPIDLAATFRAPEYVQWNAMRQADDSRFVALVLPHVLMRRPHADTPLRTDGFCYQEDTSAPDRTDFLWGSAIWALGSVVIRAFTESGWLADIRGVDRGVDGGGLVSRLCVDHFSTDHPELIPKPSTDVVITDAKEREISDLGFIPLSHCHGTPAAAFYGCQSIQQPQVSRHEPAAANAKISAMLHYLLCVSRFAHYIKVIGRDRVGSFSTAEECERYMNDWLVDYSTASDDVSSDLRAQYPLREASVAVREVPGRPGVYRSIIHLRPHYQLDQMSVGVKLVTELFKEHGR